MFWQCTSVRLTTALILVISLSLMAVACIGDDGVNVRSVSAEALNTVPATADESTVHYALDNKLDGDDLIAVESSVKEARARNATLAQIASALAAGDGDNRNAAVRIIKTVNATSVATGTPTTTAQTAAQIKADILKEVDAKIATAQGASKAQYEVLKATIEKANADAVANLKDYWMTQIASQPAGQTSDQVKADILKEVDAKIATATGDFKKHLEAMKVTITKANADAVANLKDFWMTQLSMTGSQTQTLNSDKPGKVVSAADVRAKVGEFASNGWKVTTYDGVTDQMVGWFQRLKAPDPVNWKTWPNVPNPDVPSFRVEPCKNDPSKPCVPDGMYYGLDERNYFQTGRGAVIVPSRGFNDITGDYDFGFINCSAAETKRGCAVLLVNVGEVSTVFEDMHVNHGFSVDGKYFNGDTLEVGIWGVTSHTTAAMLNMPVVADAINKLVLNAGGSDTNAGANCSVAAGCRGVLWRVVILSGNQVLAVAETTFDKQ